MTYSTREAGPRPAGQRIHALLSGRLPILITFGCLIIVNWAMALWLIQRTWQAQESALSQMINAESQYAGQMISRVFQDADRRLSQLRALRPDDELRSEFARWTRTGHSGGVALIAPDGRVLAASPGAGTAGWPRLMTRLAASADELAIGEPILGKNGHLTTIPVARRVVDADGSFAGILLHSIERDMFPGPSPAILGLEGSLTVISDDDIVLARVPDVRGTVGSRMTRTVDIPKAQASPAVISRHVSRIDGVDRIYSHRRLTGVPATLIVGVGYDAAFADWDSLRLTVIGARSVASGLILLAGFFWYTRRSRARISANALAAILTSVEHGIRVETSDHRIIAANEAGATLPRPGSANERTEMRRKDGAIIQITRHDLADGGSVLVGADVTERHAAEARIDFLTNHDRLTGLPNRWRATACIQDVLARPSGSPRLAALMLLDLDGFQDINDTIGHEGGDEVLTEIAGRLRDLVGGHDYVGVRLGRDDIVPRLGRDDIAPRLGGDVMAPIRGDVMVPIRGDVVARLGGDEFLLFLEDPDDEAAVMCLTRQISRILARPIAVRGQQVRLGASMGIAFHPGDGADVTTLFRHADIALSSAKLAGRGTARSFDATMMASFEEHRMMESDLRRALDGDELELRLQPQFSCETLEVTGFEALARWRHPTRGDVSPTIFIPIAERSGLINPLGLWAIEQACKAAAGWRSRHRVAVNLSPLQLRGETIQEDIRGILRRTQFPAHLLELEVTESVLLDEDQRTLEALHKLRAMDIRVTLDDFGTGYSSLGYLRRFPFDKIKIDKSFIQGQGTDRGTRVILEAMIRMCTDLGFDVVAEGVETEHQLNELRLLGCREIQGFLLGEPLRPEMVEEFLADHERGLVSGRHRSPTCVDS